MRELELTIKCWNIYGVFRNMNGFRYNKLHEQDFLNEIKDAKIFGLVETHHTDNDIDQLQLKGYCCYQVNRSKLKHGRKH